MDELSSVVVDPEELMDLDEGDGSDLDEDEEDVIEDTLPSPLQLPSSGPASTATSVASSPPTNDDVPPVFNFTGKPLNIKRGRGRPRREGGKPIPRRQSSGVRMKRWRPHGYSGRGVPKRVKSFDRDYESPITPSPVDEISLLDPETGALILSDREKPNPHTEELPYAPEQWPGKVCGFCNLGERSQLGQGEMLRLTCPEGFIPQRIVSDTPDQHIAEQTPERDMGDKSPRGPVTCRRQKSFNKCRHPSMTSEYVDELTIIGHSEEPDVNAVFEASGHFYVHRNCALWSNGVVRKENMALENVGQALLLSAAKKCSHCNHYGASLPCKKDGCGKMYHFPCATASGAFQELSALIAFCANHLTQAALMCEGSVCFTCKTLGDISNLMYCSVCGEHYHGTCVGLAQMPGVRAGWQCRKCRVCQVCRMIGDESKLMACEQCDKVYHAMCQRPVVTSIPKYGWKCRCCRVCGDCGSRTPGAGLSSRWHSHYTVCDSCYQQRNKGYSCPLCHRAYRAHAYREMVQCVLCRKFVHGTCDPEADLTTYHLRKEAHPEYEYVCSICKNRTQQGRPMLSKRNSTEDPGGDSLSASQESLYDDVYEYDPERCASEDAFKGIGLGRGKPYSASKIAKKRLGLSTGAPGRPKGVGKGLPGKVGFMKRQRLTEFGRKRGPKAKMRGIFGVPGVGLQRPVSDGNKADEEPGIENRLILCSAKDKFVLTQDICVMCGALGTDQEGCLIACVQCGQCYHPYCVNVKVTKVILQKGWRCLDCTVCEGCGQRNDEGRLLLCDDCDISYHIYCMDPPLNYVPQGTWKCKWCVVCQTCGSTDPGFNCNWMNSFSECGPCASHQTCASCSELYADGDLIIQCVQCERWLHGACDAIKTEADAEKCAEDGYNCVLCRPRDVPPPHLLPAPAPKPPSPTKSPEVKSNAQYYIDGVYLSETGHSMIKSLSLEQQIGTRKKRKKISSMQDKEAGIMATIESVIAGSSGVSDNGLEDNAKLELIDVKDEPQELYKEGMLWAKEDGPPPDGFTLFTMENGMTVLRRKRQRNLQKLGIGGFFARVRGVRSSADNEDFDLLTGQSSALSDPLAPPTSVGGLDGDKPRRKPIRRKPKSKLAETFPPYLQEAFFGKELLDSHKDLDSTSGSDDENATNTKHLTKSIQLSQDEIKAVAAVTAKQDNTNSKSQTQETHKQTSLIMQEKQPVKIATVTPKEEEESDTDDLSLALPRDLLDTDLVNTIMNEEDDELTKNTDTLENLADGTLTDAGDISDSLSGAAGNSKDTKDELSDILLGSNFNPETIPYINSKDVEDILFKGVLTDESQESQESNIFSATTASVFPAAPASQQSMVAHPISAPAVRPSTLPNVVNQNSLSSPLSFPPQSPYQSEYSNSPQFSPAFSEPPSPWVTVNDAADLDNAVVPSTYNQRSSEKMKADEGLGSGATISAVLYANMNHPEWKSEYPSWSDRYKQIIKKWRTLSPEQKAPYLLQAKDNRSALRMKKQQQISGKESGGGSNNSNNTTTTITTNTTTTSTTTITATNQNTALTNPGMAALPSSQHRNAKPSLAAVSSMSPSPQQLSVVANTTTMMLQQQSSQLPVTAAALAQNPIDSVANNNTTTTLFQSQQQQLGQQQPVHHHQLQKDHHHLHQTNQHHQIQAASSVLSVATAAMNSGSQEDPEKSVQQQKSAREAEQERQWKQLQALRQQQQQHQQQIIQEQRVQARVHRSISDSGAQQFLSAESTVLQSSPQQDITSPHHPASPRTFNTLGIKSPPTFTHPGSVPVTRPPTPQQQPVVTQDFIAEPADPFSPTPPSTNPKTPTTPSNLRLPVDPYSHQPATPRPVSYAGTPRPTLQGIVRQDGGSLEINHRQLKDLLQRQQQFKKLDEQLLPGKGQQRVWPPPEAGESVEQVLIPPSPNEPTFRHPLPPAMRPRIPLPTSNVIRQPGGGIVGLRMQTNDPRFQGLKLILHQQQQQRTVPTVTLHQQFPGGTPRFPQNVTRPAGVEQYEQIQRQVFQPRTAASELQQAKLHLGQQPLQKSIAQSTAALATAAQPTSGEPAAGEQEIPDNVTAELEKLEQDSTMVELQGVGDLLGGLPEDDDELLAEMGNDFNILEYADPELDALTGGEKTNILDSLDLVEPEPVKEEKKVNKNSNTNQVTSNTLSTTTTQSIAKTETKSLASSSSVGGLQLPPLTVSQSQPVQQPPQPTPTPQPQLASQQQIHQQMLQNVQQPTPDGRAFLTRTRIMTREGIVGAVMTNNNVTLNLPAGYQHQQLLVQIQKLQMRQNATMVQGPRLAGPVIHGAPSRINVAVPPPPPPPYPGPPPPYPGSTTPQEQPLLLQELLEEEQREQEKQLQSQSMTSIQNAPESSSTPVLLSDHEFERVKADVLNSGPLTLGGSTATVTPAAVQNVLSSTAAQTRPTFQTQVSNTASSQSQWQTPQTPQTATDTSPRVPTFNANFLAAPPLPPEHIVTEQDKQTQNTYEQWLNHQNMMLGQQLKFYEGEVQKLRKMRKSLNSKQRQLRKCGNQLPESDASELQRIATEQSILQKHLESSRKQSRQHGMLIQEYRNKQQAKQRPGPGQSPLLTQSPLGPPASSPIHPANTPQSPMMSPTASPMTQHSSPMHSPAPLVSHSPGPGSVSSVLQSPSNPTASGMSPMQPSPRIGTPHSQSEGSPGPVQSPSQVCLPPPMPRMTSPQHRRVVTSPIGYAGDLRPGTSQALGQLRFARPQLDAASLQQRTRLQSPSPSFQQKPCAPSPLNSPPTQQMTINQQMLQRHLQQQALLQQQQVQQQAGGDNQGDCTLTNSQRTLQLIQQRQLALRQQQLAQQQQGGAGNQPQPLTPQQHQLMVQQQQQLAKQQQQQIAQIQAQVRMSQQHNQPPSSPMPPSPHVNQSQIMSPHSLHSQPASPMPPRSPMVSSSPVPRSPAIHQAPAPGQQPPSSPMMHSSAASIHQPPNSPMPRSPMIVGQIQSPMGIRRPPSTGSSPVIPDRPKSVENPGTPRMVYHQLQEHDHTGGGNSHNPSNPIPYPPGFGRFGYFKLGLRGGSPMWGYGRGAKRLPNGDGKEEKSNSSELTAPPPKFKKESHVSRVTILKKKSPIKSNLQGLTRINSLVSSDYNEFDDSSSTPPITPPPSSASTSGSGTSQRALSRSIGKKVPPGSNHQNEQLQVIDRSPEDKQLSIMDYDDDTVISTEVSLSSAAQQADCEEITVIESFSQTGLESFSSPLESDQIPEDFLLFDLSAKEMEEDEAYHVNDNNVRFVLQSPTSSDEELHGLQIKSKQQDTLSLNLIESITDPQRLPSESPTETEEPSHVEAPAEENFEEPSHLVIIDASTKSPEEISTKEDFEELIDEGSRKEKIIKPGIINSKHINEIHKYAAPNVFTFTSPTPKCGAPATSASSTAANVVHANVRPNTINIRPAAIQGPKISLIAAAPVITASSNLPTAKLSKNIIQSPKVQNNIASIIFPIKTTLRSNVIGVPKIVNSVAPAITIVSGTTTQIANIIPSHFTVPVISASAVSKLPNVKVIDKPSTSLSLTSDLPKKIFEDDSKSPDSSNCEEDKLKLEQHLSKLKEEQQQNEDETLSMKTKDAKEEYEIACEDVKKENEQKEIAAASSNNGSNVKSPMKNKTSPLIIHNPPELKMTAQVIQEPQALIRSTTLETFITQAVEEVDGNSNDLDSKSVVISIPSPTPSQEQILDHISLQALENRRQDGKFEYFDSLLEMIEDMDKEETNNKLEIVEPTKIATKSQTESVDPVVVKVTAQEVKETAQIPVSIVTSTRGTVMPQLSPLSQPSELTSNIANGSQQLRTLLSSFTTTVTSSSNVGTVAKTVTYNKEKTVNLSTSSPLAQMPRIITQQNQQNQQPHQHQAVTNAASSPISSVIVTNIKQKIVSPKTSPTATTIVTTSTVHLSTSPLVQQTVTVSAAATTQSILNPIRSSASIQLISDHPKLSHPMQVSQTVVSMSSATSEQKTIVTTQTPQSQPLTSTTISAPARKTSLSLNEMLQSHPAATVPQTSPGTITTASILGSALPLSRSGFSAALVQAQPHVISSVTSSVNTGPTQQFKPALGTTNLLHSQLTKTPVSRTRSFDEIFEKRIEREPPEHSSTNASESTPSTPVSTQAASSLITTSSLLKDVGGCKFSTLHPANRLEDSQNVLLKQLLQNTACASLQTTTSTTVSTTMSSMTAPSLPIVPNLEAQLARPVPPTPSSLIPPMLQNDTPSQQQQHLVQTQVTTHSQTPQQQPQQQNNSNNINHNHNHNNNNNNNVIKSQILQVTQTPITVVHQRQPIMTRETSFVSKPLVQSAPVSLPASTAHQQTLHIDIKKCLPPSRDDLLSPPTPRSTCSQDSNLTTPPLIVKKELNVPTTLQSPLLTPQEVKKEFIDESSQHSEVSDQSRCDLQMKEELMDIDTEKMDKEELKKMKRRMYQQKRRQNQILNKEIAGQPKKRPRKSSKVDEDYDSYIEGVLAQLRTLPPMVVSEPVLNKNFGIVPTFGCGELTKLGCREYDSRFGDLKGSYGNAEVPGYSDYYSTKPYGEFDPLPEKAPSSTQRGFYDQEFSLIKFDTDEDRRFDLFSRDDSPDSVISSSSPECPVFEPILKFPGLKLIDEEDEIGDEMSANVARPLSPIVPIVAPIPIRLKPSGPYLKDFADVDKENIGKEFHSFKSKFSPTPVTPLKDSGNVTVTLTLTSSAAEDIMGVLRDLANILHIPAPTSYQIVERTSTPPSQKLGLYRTKGKDGKEGAPIDIQSILNGAAKFCKHCDVVILNNMIRKKISELPFLSKDTELLGDGDELFFCSSTCYMQFALMHRSPSLTEDKAAAIVDHLCQKDKADHLRKRQVLERQRAEVYNFEAAITRRQQHFLEKMDIDLQIKKEEFPPDDMHLDFMKPDCFLERTQKVEEPANKWKNQRYKKYASGCLQPRTRYKKASDKETMELLYKLGVTVAPTKNVEDTRKCMFCHNVGDGVADGPARLLNFDVDKWVHLNCALWSDGVYETVNGALMQLENALQQSLVSTCVHCNNLGATIRCFKTRCSNIYHLPCAIKDRCVFYKNKTTYCVLHVPKNEKDNELTTLSVSRRVYVNRDENRQVAAVMHHSDQNNLLRVGSLIFLSVGQLLPHQLQNFHTSNYIYPIGYKIVRFYWSMRHVNKRCRYICSIQEMLGRPEFRIVVQEAIGEELEFRDTTAKGVWHKVIEPIANLRKENQCVHVFPKYVTGEDLFGLTEPAVVRVLESLPGIETLTDYKFKYGRNPLLELPLAINPSGAARTEPRLRNQLHWKRAHTQRTGSSARPVFAPTAVGSGEVACPYSKQFVHSKSSQYKKMKQEWRNNVYLARSKIQGLGLYAARDLEKHTMVIEYIGEIIRTELAETREKKYEAKNRGIYMFRLDEERVVDATLSGGLARYINHSCNPNCVAEIVEVDRDLRIIIFAKRRIQRGEELAYDYKFDIEDDQHKISCMCGAPNCRKWMN